MPAGPKKKFLINFDMGEGFGLYKFGQDEQCIKYSTHVNIACGFHASDPTIMWKTVRLAKDHGVGIGAHPGLPDREGFGRRAMAISRHELTALMFYQVGALSAFLDREGVPLTHIKPHGMLFGMAMRDRELAEGVADVVQHYGVPAIVVRDCEMEKVYKERGIEHHCEFYADLDYTDDGYQIISKEHHAIDPAAAARKCVEAIEHGRTISINGKTVPARADSICIHSDTPNAVDVAKAVWEAVAPYR